MKVREPLQEPRVSSAYDFGSEFLNYNLDITLRESRAVETVYDRLYRWKVGRNKIDQIDATVRCLRKESTSRRAIAMLWNPAIDLNASHPMCFLTLAFRLKSTGLHLTAVLRSNDAWFAAPADMKALTELQKLVASELEVTVGTYVHHSISYHIYDYDVPRAASFFAPKQSNLFAS